jgi:hypothetical protein
VRIVVKGRKNPIIAENIFLKENSRKNLWDDLIWWYDVGLQVVGEKPQRNNWRTTTSTTTTTTSKTTTATTNRE